MTDYYIYSGAGGTPDGQSWNTAYTSWSAMLAVKGNSTTRFADGDRVFVADVHVDTSPGADVNIYGPGVLGEFARIISSDVVGTGTDVSYLAGTEFQIDASASYNLIFNEGLVVEGIKMRGIDVQSKTATDDTNIFRDCHMTLGTGNFDLPSGHSGKTIVENCTLDVNSTSGTSQIITFRGALEINKLDIVNAGNRTGSIFIAGAAGTLDGTGIDWSSASCPVFTGSANFAVASLAHCLIGSGSFIGSTPISLNTARIMCVNCFSAFLDQDDPSALFVVDAYGELNSTRDVTKDVGPAQVEGISHSWLIETHPRCKEGAPFFTPWQYGTLSSVGVKTFSLSIAHNEADAFTDAEVWLEVEVMGTEDVSYWTRHSDYRGGSGTTRANSLSAATAQATDTGATWTGLTDETVQLLSVTNVTVGEAGLFRWRVAVGVNGVTSLYVNPRITVS